MTVVIQCIYPPDNPPEPLVLHGTEDQVQKSLLAHFPWAAHHGHDTLEDQIRRIASAQAYHVQVIGAPWAQ